jgi:hypothetical protein
MHSLLALTLTAYLMSSTVRRYPSIATDADAKNSISLTMMVGAKGIEPWTSPV